MLADYAAVSDTKLNIIGGGWTVTGPDVGPFGIAMLFEIPWDVAEEPVHWELQLLDQDGRAVLAAGPDGLDAIVIGGHFELSRPPDVKPGVALTFPLALNFPPPPLEPGNRYEWRMTVNGVDHEDWRTPFSVRPRD